MIQGFSSGLLNRELIYQTDLPSFQRDFASLKTLDHGTGPNITFTRGSNATYFDADGTLQTASNDVARFDHDPANGSSLGLLIEEARTNSIRNSQAGGAVVGAPGTIPTYWSTFESGGISREVVGVGTASGFNYIDIKFSGTDTGSGSSIAINTDGVAQVVATTGQSWSAFAYIALVGGTFSGAFSPAFRLVERTAAGVAISGAITSISIAGAGATLSKFEASRTMAGAGVERVSSQVSIGVTASATIDFTLRIAAPQLEQGAFPTSYIPTTTAAATRAADSAVVTPISSFYNQAEGTLFAEGSTRAAGERSLVSVNDNTADNRARLETNGTDPRLLVTSATAEQAAIDAGTVVANTTFKLAAAMKTDDFAASEDGLSVVTDTSGTLPTGLTHLHLGSAAGSAHISGYLRKIAYWPKRLTNTLLEQLTT